MSRRALFCACAALLLAGAAFASDESEHVVKLGSDFDDKVCVLCVCVCTASTRASKIGVLSPLSSTSS